MPRTLSLVKFEVAGRVAAITLNRPGQLNALNWAVVHQLQQALDEAAGDPNVEAIVLGGEGKAFVAGADVGFLLRNVESGDLDRIVRFTEAGHRLLNAIDHCPKRVVARLHGAALGAGVELALACDRVVASPRASLGFPETGLGIYPALGGTQRAPRAVGVGLAKWLIFTGKTLSAAEAQKIGLVHHVVPHEQLDEAARRCARGDPVPGKAEARSPELIAIERFFLAGRVDDLRTGAADAAGDATLARAMRMVAGKAPIALRLAERLIEQGSRQSLEAGLQMEIDHVPEIYATEDARRGLSFCVNRQVGQAVFAGR
jgi:enoyl-CoA hydratase/3-hydroxyacyl-CoA dehydrogenase